MSLLVEFRVVSDDMPAWQRHDELTPGRTVSVGRRNYPDSGMSAALSRKQLQFCLDGRGDVIVTSGGGAVCMQTFW